MVNKLFYVQQINLQVNIEKLIDFKQRNYQKTSYQTTSSQIFFLLSYQICPTIVPSMHQRISWMYYCHSRDPKNRPKTLSLCTFFLTLYHALLHIYEFKLCFKFILLTFQLFYRQVPNWEFSHIKLPVKNLYELVKQHILLKFNVIILNNLIVNLSVSYSLIYFAMMVQQIIQTYPHNVDVYWIPNKRHFVNTFSRRDELRHPFVVNFGHLCSHTVVI